MRRRRPACDASHCPRNTGMDSGRPTNAARNGYRAFYSFDLCSIGWHHHDLRCPVERTDSLSSSLAVGIPRRVADGWFYFCFRNGSCRLQRTLVCRNFGDDGDWRYARSTTKARLNRRQVNGRPVDRASYISHASIGRNEYDGKRLLTALN
ncbi:MAG: hypothetical protein ACI9G1_004210 [Pirellulaceae bacterium]|jgi:hypothetical protein